LSNYSFDASKGFLFALRFKHVESAILHVEETDQSFIMLSTATAEPAPPSPGYNLPVPDTTEVGQDSNSMYTDM